MIETLPIKIGDVIESEGVLATLDSESYRVLLAQAKADVAQTYATQKSSQSEYKRIQQLFKKNVVSKNQLEQSEAEAKSTRAAYDAALQAEQLAQLNLDDTVLTVGSKCRIAQVFVRQNENISAGQPIAQASCGDTWEVHINVPESLIDSFSNGMEGKINFPSLPNQTFDGVVSEVGVSTNDSSSFPVTLELTAPPSSIRSNVAAEVSIKLAVPEKLKGVVYVPSAAVVSDHNGPFVYIVEPTEKPGVSMLKRQSVSVGLITPFGLQVKSGLEAGKEVLLSGHVNGRDGLEVKATLANQK